MGMDEEWLKNVCLNGDAIKEFGNWGAKKIATLAMLEGGLATNDGQLKYHASKETIDYKKYHHALTARIQRWINSSKKPAKKGHEIE